MIVIDASALAKALVERSASADAVRERVVGEVLTAPALIDAEVLSVVRGLHRGGALPLVAARRAVDLLGDLPLQRAPMSPHLGRAWQLRENYSAYDAFYVALAELLACPLVTSDARLSGATGATCTVELFG